MEIKNEWYSKVTNQLTINRKNFKEFDTIVTKETKLVINNKGWQDIGIEQQWVYKDGQIVSKHVIVNEQIDIAII